MNTGTIISGVGHGALILWVLFGHVFSSDTPPPEVIATDVTLITAEEFAVLTASDVAPALETSAPEVGEPDDTLEPLPVPEQVNEAVPQQPALPQPPAEAPPPPDAAPEIAALVPPPPDLAVEEAAPAPPAPPEVLAPESPDLPPSPEAAPRVASEAVPEPLPDATPDPEVREEAVLEAESETTSEETETTAPEAATTEIVTEADRPASAPDASPRPPSRPQRPVQTAAVEPERPTPPQPEAPPTPPQPEESDPLQSALAEALEESDAPAAPSNLPEGEPLTSAEKERLRLAVRECWNVGALSSEALRTVVTVLVAMGQDGVPTNVELLDSTSSSDAATQTAYQTARRAIIRCGARGYDLPADKYSQWREIEITFNPEEMRRR